MVTFICLCLIALVLPWVWPLIKIVLQLIGGILAIAIVVL